jgi:methyl-accepting chemotaxis protein
MSASALQRLARIFYWPVYFFIERVRFARSLLLLVLLIPDGYVAWMLVNQTTKDVDFSRKEAVGVDYITPARAMLASLQKLRVIGNPALGPKAAGENAALAMSIDDNLKALQKTEDTIGTELGTADVLKRITNGWTALKPLLPSPDAAARDKAFADLTGLIASDLIVNTAGNNSNLILDPDLDSFYMMDAFVVKLPALGELSATAGTGAIAAIGDQTLTTQERLDLAGTLGLLSSTTSDLINVDLKAALDDNEKFNEGRQGNGRLRSKLEKSFASTATQLNAFAQELHDKLLLPAQPGVSAAEVAALSAGLIDQVHELQKLVGPELKLLCDERADRYRHTRFIGILVFIAAALLISYVFNGFTSSVKSSQRKLEDENRRLQGDIVDLLGVVSEAADGNLTARAKVTEGSLGNVADAFNQMMESWQELVGTITSQLDRTTHAVGELDKAANVMTAGASAQAEAVQAATGAVSRVNDAISRVSVNAENAAGAAQRTQQSALEGSQSVGNVVQGMESLRSLVQAGAKKIKLLGDRSLEITSIVGTIARISEQTNMLALNAAIEAARAGDQGRGFSVVADEVRKLAERTATATQEIDKLVKAIQTETTESVGAIERQTQVVEDEGARVAGAGAALARIQDVSTHSSLLATDIAGITRSQVADASSAAETMQRISAIARETESHARSSLAIARDLGELSDELRRNVGRFKVH